MKKNKKSDYQSFSKPFWKLLSVSLLSAFFVYGGLVWATITLNGCDVQDDALGTSQKVCLRMGLIGTITETLDITNTV